MSDTLTRFQEWYASQCNGDWEHSYGVKITTLDNPGWSVVIELTDTPYASQAWLQLKVDCGDNDWIICSKTNRTFKGHGDPSKLEAIMAYFLDCVDRGTEMRPPA